MQVFGSGYRVFYSLSLSLHLLISGIYLSLYFLYRFIVGEICSGNRYTCVFVLFSMFKTVVNIIIATGTATAIASAIA